MPQKYLCWQKGVASSVIHYNDGVRGFKPVFEMLNVSPGSFTSEEMYKKDVFRVRRANAKSDNTIKLRRKKLRGIKKGFLDKEKEQEGGESYSSGNFMQFSCSLNIFVTLKFDFLKTMFFAFFREKKNDNSMKN